MRTVLAIFCVVLPPLLAGCGGGGGGDDALFGGPMMFIGAQINIYDGFEHNFEDLNGDGLDDLFYVGNAGDGGNSLFVGLGAKNEFFGEQNAIGAAERVASADVNADGRPDIVALVPLSRRGGEFDRDVEIFLSQEDGSFDSSGLLGVQNQMEDMQSIATGDVNDDGLPDILIGGGVPSLLLLINQGGSFEAQPDLPETDAPLDVRIVDVNADGFGDLILSGIGDSRLDQITLLLSHGDGTVDGPRVIVPSGRSAILDAEDFNGDGFLDFASTHEEGLGIEVYLGDASATYATMLVTDFLFPLPFYNPFAIGDFNEDGDPDIAFIDTTIVRGARGVTNVIYLALGLGNGQFDPELVTVTETDGFARGVTDLNRDGHLDILVSLPDTSLWSAYFGNGDGTFQSNEPSQIPLGILSSIIPLHTDPWQAPDLDQDGNPDVVTASLADTALAFHYGRGDGTFTEASLAWPANGRVDEASVLADLDGDSNLDIIGTSQLSGYATIFRNYGDRDIQALPVIQVSASSIDGPEFVGDIDKDGNADVLFNGTNVPILYGAGNMQFEPRIVLASDPGRSWRYAGDVTGDDINDLIAPASPGGGIVVWPGLANRIFGSPVASLAGMDSPSSSKDIVFADLNLDDRLDVAGFWEADGSMPPEIVIAFGQSDASFLAQQTFTLPDDITFAVCRAADLDGDTDTDVFCNLDSEASEDGAASSAITLMNNGTGTFTQGSLFKSFVFEAHGNGLSLTDISADGVPDVLHIGPETGLSVALGLGDGTFGPTHYFGVTSASQALAGDFDDDGDGDIAGISGNDSDALFLMENLLFGH